MLERCGRFGYRSGRDNLLRVVDLVMNHWRSVAFASVGVFIGSLLSDVLLGDGIQIEDVEQAALVALVAAVIQWFLQSSRR